MVLHLLITGKLVTKSKLQEWKHSGGTNNGQNALGRDKIESLFWAQTRYDLQYAVRFYRIFGHQTHCCKDLAFFHPKMMHQGGQIAFIKE